MNPYQTTHGMSYTRLYKSWRNMKTRCDNKNIPHYESWGGRGITYCSEWKEFPSFRDWAISSGYTDNLTLERINNDGKYEPSNCKWIPKGDQHKNNRNTIYIDHFGKKYTLRECATAENIKLQTVKGRYAYGDRTWERLTRPVCQHPCGPRRVHPV